MRSSRQVRCCSASRPSSSRANGSSNSARAGPRQSSSASAERRGGLVGSTRAQCLAAAGVQLLEAAKVEGVSVELDQVAGRARAQQLVRQLLAQLGDEDLHHLLSAVRHLVAPEVVDEPIHRHDPVGVQQQQREQGLLLAARQPDGPGVVTSPREARESESPSCPPRGLPCIRRFFRPGLPYPCFTRCQSKCGRRPLSFAGKRQSTGKENLDETLRWNLRALPAHAVGSVWRFSAPPSSWSSWTWRS